MEYWSKVTREVVKIVPSIALQVYSIYIPLLEGKLSGVSSGRQRRR